MVAVHCQHCDARYETDLPVSAIQAVRRCSRCGYPELEAVRDGDAGRAEAAREPDER